MFIVLPVGVNYETNRYPVITFTLMGINTLVYLASLVFTATGGEETQAWIYEKLWLTPCCSAWYAYLTSMFVHAGFFHLLGNMIYLFLFGCCVEDVIGRWKFTIFYLLGGWLAEFTHIAATPGHFGSDIPLGGASGAVTTCIAGFLVLFSKQEIEFKYVGFFFFRFFAGEFTLAAWVVITFWFAKDLLFAALTFASETTGGGVAFAAHVGGFIGGLGMICGYKLLERKLSEEVPVAVWQPTFTPTRKTRELSEAELNETPAIFLSDDGVESGPFTTHQVRQMVSLGSISSEAFYWQDGMTEWSTIQDFSA
jgi:rhomboid family protein